MTTVAAGTIGAGDGPGEGLGEGDGEGDGEGPGDGLGAGTPEAESSGRRSPTLASPECPKSPTPYASSRPRRVP